ncbi:phosphatase [Nocardia sp. NBC_01503]|uniref:phosphatase n=1 Tax=Nocardia sp. NBC_01503 TaxID=2975997 RepID=UPI002E7C16B6|nr:phosphatase [Nocardia sp. NBC_01503]WTL29824.1 phosphatase [Nocardia sp. NBC_01503]
MGPTREQVVAHLMATGMAGQVATPRENNLDHFQRLAYRDPHYMFGLNPGREWDQAAILDLMARKVGVDPRASFQHGVDTIDPELTVAALDRYAARFDKALREKQRVLFATGHPERLTRLYQRLAAALAEAGGTVVEAGAGSGYDGYTRRGWQRLEIDFSLGVATVGDTGGAVHTHSDRPIRLVLAALAKAGQVRPDLVVADHGWCGGAAFAGIDAIGFADCNDPALFVGEEEGTVAVAVPLDDGLDAEHYDLLGEYILGSRLA